MLGISFRVYAFLRRSDKSEGPLKRLRSKKDTVCLSGVTFLQNASRTESFLELTAAANASSRVFKLVYPVASDGTKVV